MEAGEIFHQVISSSVTVSSRTGTFAAPRMLAAIKRLVANAVKGDIGSADVLIEMHAYSVKHGDFYAQTKIVHS